MTPFFAFIPSIGAAMPSASIRRVQPTGWVDTGDWSGVEAVPGVAEGEADDVGSVEDSRDGLARCTGGAPTDATRACGEDVASTAMTAIAPAAAAAKAIWTFRLRSRPDHLGDRGPRGSRPPITLPRSSGLVMQATPGPRRAGRPEQER